VMNGGHPPVTNPRHIAAFAVLLAGLGLCALAGVILSGHLLASRSQAKPPVSPTEDGAASSAPAPTPVAVLTGRLPAFAPSSTSTATPTPSRTATPSAMPEMIAESPSVTPEGTCTPPAGWEIHHVEPGETLFAYVLGASIAGTTITTNDLRQVNCLVTDLLQIGQALYLPPGAAENAPSSEPVGVPGGGSGPRAPQCDPHCTISIRPGWRAEQIAAVIDNTPVGFWGADFLAAIRPDAGLPAYDFLASKPSSASLEGYLYPGTYELANDTTAAAFRDMLLAAFAAQYTPDMSAAAAAHGLTFYQALTLASIIQRESWAYNEQVLISSVFHNHLRRGDTLSATVTLQYALGGPGDWWPAIRGSAVNTPSPYNTNLNPGLPPSPIDSPGSDAIRAALNPAATDYLFFTGNCNGSGNLYAATYQEHLANVNACR